MLELFVSGSEKYSGKTFITAGLAATMQSLGYSTSVYKPVQTGAIEKNGFIQAPDLAFVKFVDPYIKTYFSYLLKNNIIPAVAAELEQISINKEIIYQDYESIKKKYECILTDGTMGLSTPLGDDFLEQDLVSMLNIPVLIVVSPSGNSVNNTISEVNQAMTSGIKIRGVVINNCPENFQDLNVKSLPKLIEKYTDVKILGIMPYIGDLKKINPNDLISNILTGIDIESVFDIKIAKLEL